MKRLTGIVVVFLITMTGYGQSMDDNTARIDSLKEQIKEIVDDSLKIIAYREWDMLIYASDPKQDVLLVGIIDSICEQKLQSTISVDQRKFFELQKAWIHWSYGILDRDQRDYAKSSEHYRSAANTYKKYNKLSFYSRVIHAIGLNFLQQDLLDSAMIYFNRSWEVKREIKYYGGLGYTYMDIGTVYGKQGKYNDALDFLERSLAVYDSLKQPDSKKDVYHRIGDIYLDLKDYKKASDYLEDAMTIEEGLKDVRGLKVTYVSLSKLYFNMGNTKKGTQYRDLAVDLYRQLHDSLGLFELYFSTGKLLVEHGNYSLANDYLLQARELGHTLNSKVMESKACWYLGWSDSQMGYHSESLKNFSASYELRKEGKDNYSEASALGKMAQEYQYLGNKTMALELSRKSIDLIGPIDSTRRKARLLNDRSAILKSFGEEELSRETIYEALEVLDAIHDSSSIVFHWLRCQLNEYYRKNNQLGVALRNSEAMKQCATEKYNLRILKIANHEMAKTFAQMDQIDSAQKYLSISLVLANQMIQSNFSTMTEAEKESYFELSGNELFEAYRFAHLFHDSHPECSDQAFDIALMTKGMLLTSASAIRLAILSSGDSVLTEKYYHWIGLQNGINELKSFGRDASHLQIQAEVLEKELVKSSREFSDLSDLLDLKWEEVRARLNENEAVVEFVKYSIDDSISGDLYSALIIRPEFNHPKMVYLFDEATLTSLIGSYPGNTATYINSLYGTRAEPKSELYDLIWKPIATIVGNAEKVYVSPVGLLHKISLATMTDEDGTPLQARHNLQLLSSSSKLVLPSRGEQNLGVSPISLFGGIQYSTSASTIEVWSYLQGTLEETNAIDKIVRKNERPVYYYAADKATEERFKEKSGQCGIVHVATHGFFYSNPDKQLEESVDEKESEGELIFRGVSGNTGKKSFMYSPNPLMRSGLVFAGANDVWQKPVMNTGEKMKREDGVLTAAEVSTLDLRRTELVVLSACETGLGDIKGAEGVYGLQRAFKMAGVKYIIMSLWQVPDKETAEFMTTFYQYLDKTNDIKRSFYLTQMEMWKKYDPYFWGAFVLIE